MADVEMATTEDDIAVVTINRPDRRNALSANTLGALHRILDAIASQPQVRAVVVTGAGSGIGRENGRATPYNVINSFTCRYNGAVVLSSTFSSGIAANPSLQFYVRARESGELTFEWRDDEGRQGRARLPINLVG